MTNKNRDYPGSRRSFIKKSTQAGLDALLASYGIGNLINCKKKVPTDSPDIPVAIAPVNEYRSKQSWFKRTGMAIGFIVAFFGLVACEEDDNGNGNGTTTPKIGNITGKAIGLADGQNVPSGRVYFKNTTSGGEVLSTTINSDGTLQPITGVENLNLIKRVGASAFNDEFVRYEGNISLNQTGTNNITIKLIEKKNFNDGSSFRFDFSDFDTINRGGARLKDQLPNNAEYKIFIDDVNIWHYNNTTKQFEIFGAAPVNYLDNAKAHITDIAQTDFTTMAYGNYTFATDTFLIASQGAIGPGTPPQSSDKYEKEGWFYVYISKYDQQRGGLLTATSIDNSTKEILGGSLAITYNGALSVFPGTRGNYSQDTCEWVGFSDLLQKSNYSIFSDTDHGFPHGNYITDFDKWAADIKKNRDAGNVPTSVNAETIPDYDPQIYSSGAVGAHLTSIDGIRTWVPYIPQGEFTTNNTGQVQWKQNPLFGTDPGEVIQTTSKGIEIEWTPQPRTLKSIMDNIARKTNMYQWIFRFKDKTKGR